MHLLPKAAGHGLRAFLPRCAAVAPLVVTVACSSASHHPPELGDCVPEHDASCEEPLGGASGEVLPNEAGSQGTTDAGIVIGENEAGSCGMADTLLTAPCAPCIVRFCCMADSICSSDDGCLALLNCASTGTPCASLTPGSTLAFDDLQSCFELDCAQECQSLAGHDL